MSAGVIPAAEPALAQARRLLLEGDVKAAEYACRTILDGGDDQAEAWNLLGIACSRSGRPDAGVAAFRRALLLDGGRADFHMNLGNALRESGDAVRAEHAFRDALALQPSYAEAHYNLGTVLEQQSRGGEALQCYEQALQIEPGFAEAHLNIAGLNEAAGCRNEAIGHYRRALECNPRMLPAWRGLAALFEEIERLDDAVGCCRKALEIEPEDGRTLYMLGLLLERLGYTEEAAAYVSRAIKRVPAAEAVPMSLTLATLVPPVTDSNDQIVRVRTQVEQRLDVLANARLRMDAQHNPVAPPFFLSYHGYPNRRINEKLAGLLMDMSPGLVWTAPHCRRWSGAGEKIRIGFISRFLRNHSIGRTTRGFFKGLDRDRFETYALFLPPAADDEIAREIRGSASHSVVLPEALAAAREAVAALELDILFYQDVAMESMSYLMSFSRLAPVQCLSFGHPDTTGVPAMDYFVSSDLYEPEGAEAHYSETLFKLANLGTLAYYRRPRLQQPPKTRAQFGLPRDAHIYLCPQTMFKLHPDIDELFAGILRADPAGCIVLLQGKYPQWLAKLRMRLARTIPDVAGRVLFMKQVNAADFINLLAVADVSLDTPHFNGMNTSLEAFAVGTPVVTLPGAFQRGRHTQGMYRRMGISDCIAGNAGEFVAIALRLGTDAAWRKVISERILDSCGVLFDDRNVIREFSRFFETAVAAAANRARGDASGVATADGKAAVQAEEENRSGNLLAAEGKLADAEACYRRALKHAPASAVVLTNLAQVLRQDGRVEEAVRCCNQALEANPDHAPALDLQGTLQRMQGFFTEAVASYRSALERDPRALHTLNNLGITLLALRRVDEAMSCFDEAIAIDPDSANAHYDRAITWLLSGDFDRGWREYEWRWIHDAGMRERAGRYTQPRWRGEDPAGKTILLHSEQGYGDAIQFIRYAPLLAEKGANVLVHCPEPLVRLLNTVPGLAGRVMSELPEGLKTDYHCPLMSLPLLFNTTLQSVPASVPYLAAEAGQVRSWSARLPAGRLRVGLAWSSDAHRHGDGNVVWSKQSRSCPGAALAPLQAVTGVCFISLQKDPPPADAAALELTDWMEEIGDFADTAALVSSLDLVISIDTAVAHLAGALGKPVWLLLPFDGEWRWLLERGDSPWYPTASLFRQRHPGDWGQVMTEVTAALREAAAGSPPSGPVLS